MEVYIRPRLSHSNSFGNDAEKDTAGCRALYRKYIVIVEECHKALIAALEKPERKLVLRIIDAQDFIIELTSLDSFIAGFELAWRLSIELQNDENERSFSCRTRRTGARCVWDDEI